MPARPALAAKSREVRGKAVAALRRQGQLPAVVFGHGLDSTAVTVDAHEFELLRRAAGANALVDLSVDGQRANPVLIHGVQVHPVTRRPLHADLFLVRMTEELTVEVPLVATGVADAVETLGGTLIHPVEHVRVRALPDHLPQAIEYSLAPLVDFDAAIHVADLQLPEGVAMQTEAGEVIAKVLRPRIEEEEVAAAPAEAPEAPEGEAPATEEAPAPEG